MTQDELNNTINQALNDREKYNAYNPSLIAYHTHNGVDSPLVPFSGVFSVVTVSQSSNLSSQVLVLADVTSAAITLTLPSASNNFGREFIIKDWKGLSATHNITVQPSLGQKIDGASSKIINTNYASFYVVSDGANWAII